ncbi:hypothetical protein BT93_L1078 [Corymbia citriodora subsp. variegata]|uniref:Uncharacterized protein n=1 Tax=Corymbia citriodora subsp. variegata TaxID=360336 RepID=A0A8T0CPU0_CORYI|nr:hypothetical protein BT93_L1078 [Corymbia citriodora subsp. variegata]
METSSREQVDNASSARLTLSLRPSSRPSVPPIPTTPPPLPSPSPPGVPLRLRFVACIRSAQVSRNESVQEPIGSSGFAPPIRGLGPACSSTPLLPLCLSPQSQPLPPPPLPPGAPLAAPICHLRTRSSGTEKPVLTL